MFRRDFLRFLGYLSAGLIALPYTRNNEMSFSDLLLIMANNGRLTPNQLDELRRYGTETQQRNSFVAGNTTAANQLNINFPFFPIFSEVLDRDVSSLEIQIPSGYKHLIIISMGRTDVAAYNDQIVGRFNGDDGTNYSDIYEGAQSSTQLAGQNKTTRTSFDIVAATGASATSGSSGVGFCIIPHYNSNVWKSTLSIRGTSEWSATDLVVLVNSCFWRNTSKVEKINILSAQGANLVSGSIFSVYGIS